MPKRDEDKNKCCINPNKDERCCNGEGHIPKTRACSRLRNGCPKMPKNPREVVVEHEKGESLPFRRRRGGTRGLDLLAAGDFGKGSVRPEKYLTRPHTLRHEIQHREEWQQGLANLEYGIQREDPIRKLIP